MIFFITLILPFFYFGDITGAHIPARPDLAVALVPDSLMQSANAIIRTSETSMEVHSPKRMTMHVERAVTILNGKTNRNTVQVYYNQYSSAQILSAIVYDAQGEEVRKYKKRDVHDYSTFDNESLYDDYRFVQIEMRHSVYPYTVVYTYEQEFDQTQSYPDWHVQGFNESVESAKLRVTTPPEQPVYTMWINTIDTVHVSKSARSMIYEATLEHLPAIPYEENCPPSHEIFPILMLAPHAFEVAGYAGSMSDWNAFGAFMYRLNTESHQLSPNMSATVRMLTDGVDDPVERIEILYDYLKHNTRYVSVQLGIGGWKSYDAEYVEENKFGDCKALTWFMKGMLEEIGLESYPALISSDDQPLFHEDFVSPQSFDHVILHVPDHDLWVECTSNYFPLGYFGAHSADKPVLLITPDGGHVTQTPSLPADLDRKHMVDSIYLDDGVWRVTSTQNFVGTAHEECRALLYYLSESERKEYFIEEFAQPIDEIHLFSIDAEGAMPAATCEFDVSLRHLGSKSGSRYFLPLVPLYEFSRECSGNDHRTLDYRVDREPHTVSETTIVLPKGYQIESLPEDVQLSFGEIGRYQLSVVSDKAAVHVKRTLEISDAYVNPAEYGELCTFLKAVSRADRSRMVLKSGE